MSDPSFLPGQTLEAGRLRSIAPWTLLFSGTKTVANGGGSTTLFDTLANVVDNDEIPWSATSGVITLPAGGLFLVSLLGAFSTNSTGAVRRVHARGSQFGETRLAPYAVPSAGGSVTGIHASGTAVLPIDAGETIDVFGRQDSGANMTVTVYLGLTRLAPST